jgi:hypothetical protein
MMNSDVFRPGLQLINRMSDLDEPITIVNQKSLIK